MVSRHGDWANDVRYLHGKGVAPRRTMNVPLFAIWMAVLSILTIVAFITELA
ncbi:MAG: hypothetical protein QF596_09785 [Acidimicrobiales bacterium]|jgi:hypothetical protein|nr:hypothetical protein [Acidimicrobiales bacterium]MDP6298495.1 hypothetical protein [Acidimicrobiales bacterium]HJM27483.1 hypothetical protein [Acidimicrobiales bacterium]HJM98406.1 hypothetical protein [Acidimicrobiales bacterium]